MSLRELLEEKYKRIARKAGAFDPTLWVEHVLVEPPEYFRWSMLPEYKDHEWDGDVDPLYHAFKDVAAKKWVGIQAGTGTGKTYFLSRLVYWFLDTYPNALVVTSAPKQDQLKLNLWAEISKSYEKFRAIRPNADLMKLRLVADKDYDGYHAVGFVAGTSADEESATKAQGFHREHMLIILEECPGMSAQVMTAFQNTCTGENNIIVAVGNPDSEMDLLSQFCALPNVSRYRLSAYDYPNVVLGSEIIKGAVTRTSIDRRRLKYGDTHNLFLSRVRGIAPKQGVDSLVRLEWIEQCLNIEAIPHKSYPAVGVDVANSESGDKAALCWGDGPNMLDLQEFQCPNAAHLAYNLFMSDFDLTERGYKNYSTKKVYEYEVLSQMIGVDSVGVGVSTVNAFIDSGYNVTSLQGGQWDEVIPTDFNQERMYNFTSLRSQMYYELREDLREKRISIRITDPYYLERLKTELCVIRFNFGATTVSVEKKEEIKKRLGGKSPNVADAVVYWNWVRKGYRFDTGMAPISGG